MPSALQIEDTTTLSSTLTPSIVLVFTASSTRADMSATGFCGLRSAAFTLENAAPNASSSSLSAARLTVAFGHPFCCQLNAMRNSSLANRVP